MTFETRTLLIMIIKSAVEIRGFFDFEFLILSS